MVGDGGSTLCDKLFGPVLCLKTGGTEDNPGGSKTASHVAQEEPPAAGR